MNSTTKVSYVSTVNILQIGVGFHAKRIYVPSIKKFEKAGIDVLLNAGVDIQSAKLGIDEYLRKNQYDIEMLYLDSGNDLSDNQILQLDMLAAKHDINSVIISTDPIAHKKFAIWALDRGFHILMDKPISARVHVNTSIDEAKGLVDDYEEILALYQSKKINATKVFSVMVQRRYEGGYQKVFELIREVGERFNAPVTSIQASHSDGVWIFPDEVVDQLSHPYSTGYGKNSHSGYHIFDIIWQFYSAAQTQQKAADTGEAMTSFLGPRGLLEQFGQKDFASYFPDYNIVKRRTDEDLHDIFEAYGEIDAFSIIRLMKNGETICNVSTNLIHNGFSRRSWSIPNDDLYKGNGRVKHQSYSIQQGPFQNIQIHQYQSDDQHDKGAVHDDGVGGYNHFEVFVFRNATMFGDNKPSFTRYGPRDFSTQEFNSERLINESAKDEAIMEFIDCIQGRIPKSALKSPIESHAVPVKIMSAIYQSQTQQVNGKTPVARFVIKKGE